jgi:hypothetical protein
MKPNGVPRAESIPFYFREPWRLQIQGSPGKVNLLLEYISRGKASLLFGWTADSIRSTQRGISFTLTVVSYCYRQDCTHTVRSKSKQQNYCTILGSVECGPETKFLTCLHTPKNNCFNTWVLKLTATMTIRVLFYLSNSSSRSTRQDPSID